MKLENNGFKIETDEWDGETGILVIRKAEWKFKLSFSYDAEYENLHFEEILKAEAYGVEMELPSCILNLTALDMYLVKDELSISLKENALSEIDEAKLNRDFENRNYASTRF